MFIVNCDCQLSLPACFFFLAALFLWVLWSFLFAATRHREKSNVKIQRRIKLFNRFCFGQSAAAAVAAATIGCGDQPPATCICEIVVLSSVRRVHRVLLGVSAAVRLFLLAINPSVNVFHLIEKIVNKEGRSEGTICPFCFSRKTHQKNDQN